MPYDDGTKNRFNPCNRFVGDIENGLRYPFACYTKDESDARYLLKSEAFDPTAMQAEITAINSNIAAISGAISALDTKFTAAIDSINLELIDIKNRLSALESSQITIQSFIADPYLIEIGSNSTINLVWSLNKTAITQTINGDPVVGTSKQFTNVSGSTSYTLIVSDGVTTANKTATVTAANQVYYGAAASISDVVGLTKELSDNPERTITVNAGVGQYIIYAYPSRLGNVTFWVDQFEGGFEPAVEEFVTNQSGYTEKYKIYRSTNPNLGLTTVDIREV